MAPEQCLFLDVIVASKGGWGGLGAVRVFKVACSGSEYGAAAVARVGEESPARRIVSAKDTCRLTSLSKANNSFPVGHSEV